MGALGKTFFILRQGPVVSNDSPAPAAQLIKWASPGKLEEWTVIEKNDWHMDGKEIRHESMG